MCTRKECLSAHGSLSGRLHLVQDEKPASRPNCRLLPPHQPLPGSNTSHFHMRTMDLEQGSLEIHVRARPRIEGAHTPFEFKHIACKVKPPLFFIDHRR